MKNKQDYQTGWTTQTTNPTTGKKCSGGAARNLRIAQAGGANSVEQGSLAAANRNVAEYDLPKSH